MNGLIVLFNRLFRIGHLPEKWSEGFIIPLQKGDLNTPGHYRGITLLSTLGKLFTKILNNRLTHWTESYNVYIEAQASWLLCGVLYKYLIMTYA